MVPSCCADAARGGGGQRTYLWSNGEVTSPFAPLDEPPVGVPPVPPPDSSPGRWVPLETMTTTPPTLQPVSRWTWLEPALALIIAMLILAGAAALLVFPEDADDPPGSKRSESNLDSGPSAAAESPPPPEAVAAIEAVVPGLQAFVEKARGLTFKEPVDVKALSDADFRRRLDELDASDEATDPAASTDPDDEDLAGVLRALGLLDDGVDLAEEADKLSGDAIAGFYDPESNELVVRGTDPTPYVRSTIVHELTHALQDQHFELHRPDLDDRDDEMQTGFTGLVEGDAVRIEDMYSESLSPADRKAASAEEEAQASGIDEDTPPVLLELIGFPYLVGPDFARALVDQGGQAALDRAFREPPLSSEHLIHPTSFLRDDDPKEVVDPEPDGDEVDHGVLGELGLVLILEPAIGRDDALAAAEGWGGDRYTAWKEGDRYCVRARIVADSASDAREMVDAFRTWAEEKGSTKVGGRGTKPDPLGFTTCE